jgi:hypothetical protein
LVNPIILVRTALCSSVIQTGSTVLSMQYLDSIGVAADDVPADAASAANAIVHAKRSLFIVIIS